MAAFDDQLAAWQSTCANFGWISCPLLFGENEFVKDDPVAHACDPSITKSVSIGIPHPQYGIMRATAYLTSAPSLTRLINTVHHVANLELRPSNPLPHLYVGTTTFVDRIGCQECSVLGILVFEGATPADITYAPLTVAQWRNQFLPYFEDANNWVMTGWDAAGRVTEIFKPFGWNGTLFGARGGRDTQQRSTQESCLAPLPTKDARVPSADGSNVPSQAR